jgi:glutathione S-transferase
MLSEFPDLERWENNVRAVGHGTSSTLSGEEAIAIALSHQSASETGIAAHDPQGLEIGKTVTVCPDVDGGEQPVTGTLRQADAEVVAIERSSKEVGTVCVHFPRAGYKISLG